MSLRVATGLAGRSGPHSKILSSTSPALKPSLPPFCNSARETAGHVTRAGQPTRARPGSGASERAPFSCRFNNNAAWSPILCTKWVLGLGLRRDFRLCEGCEQTTSCGDSPYTLHNPSLK